MKVLLLGFGEIKEGGWTNPQWMAKTLNEKGFEVIYCNPPAYRRIKFSDIKRLFSRLKTNTQQLSFEVNNTYYPFKLFGTIFNRRILNKIKDSNLVIIFQPNWMKCIKLEFLKNKKVIYFKTDNYASISNKRNSLEGSEQSLLEISNFNCVTSKNLLKDGYYYFPNCIPKSLINDQNKYSRSMSKQNLQACFIGAIWDQKIDIDMLKKFILDNPNIDIHFAGKVISESFKQFINNKPLNFIYHGILTFSKAQELIRNCDIGLMPFRKNEYTNGMFSMKFFEYMANGIPVISTNVEMFKYLDSFSDYCIISDDFNKNDIRACKNITIDKNKIKSLLHEYTYEYRIDRMINEGMIG